MEVRLGFGRRLKHGPRGGQQLLGDEVCDGAGPPPHELPRPVVVVAALHTYLHMSSSCFTSTHMINEERKRIIAM